MTAHLTSAYYSHSLLEGRFLDAPLFLIVILIVVGIGAVMFVRFRASEKARRTATMSFRTKGLSGSPSPAPASATEISVTVVNVEENSSSVAGEKPLKAGWKAVVDEETGKTYYCEEDTGNVTWERHLVEA